MRDAAAEPAHELGERLHKPGGASGGRLERARREGGGGVCTGKQAPSGDQGARLVRSEAWQTLAPSMLMLSLLRTSTEVSLGLALCLGIGGRVEWQPRWR